MRAVTSGYTRLIDMLTDMWIDLSLVSMWPSRIWPACHLLAHCHRCSLDSRMSVMGMTSAHKKSPNIDLMG